MPERELVLEPGLDQNANPSLANGAQLNLEYRRAEIKRFAQCTVVKQTREPGVFLFKPL